MQLVVITGATSGIGQGAAQRLLAQGHEVVAGTRGTPVPAGVREEMLDLSSLASVRDFAARMPQNINALVLNAGTQVYSLDERSSDGFELTFAVNHLAHYLLARLLITNLANGGRIILTSSGTHDPLEKTGVPAPHHADAARLADPATDPQAGKSGITAGLRAYSSSKLCNLMTARTLAMRSEIIDRLITVHAYDPGYIPATKLGRNAPWPVRNVVMPVIAKLPMGKGANLLSDGAQALAGLADGSIDSDRIYMALRGGHPTWPQPSALACDDALCAKLWADSAAMVGLPG